MVDKTNRKVTLTKQCELAGINKSSLYYEGRKEPQANIELMNRMDMLHTVHPYYGSRRIQQVLQRDGTAWIGRAEAGKITGPEMHREQIDRRWIESADDFVELRGCVPRVIGVGR